MPPSDTPLQRPPFFHRIGASARRVPGLAVDAVRSRRWQRRVVFVSVGWLCFWGLAYVAVPYVAKAQIEKIASQKLGRHVTVGAVEFKPWSLELTVRELAIARATSPVGSTAASTSPQASIKRLYIDADIASLLRLAPVADAIAIDEPVVSLAYLGEGRYDIDDIVQRLQSPPDQTPGEPMRFALYNLVLNGGRVDFTDEAQHKTHALRDLAVSVPFLSNLASKRDITTSPHLSFSLNDSRFDSAAVGTPFAQTRKTDAVLTLKDLDLAPYLGYWPASLPYRLQSAVLQADIKIAFEQTPATVVRISGTVTADQVRLTSPGAPGGKLLAFERLQVVMDDVRPLDQRVKLTSVTLTAPVLDLTRDKTGQLNVLSRPSATPAVSVTPAAVAPVVVAAPVAVASAANAAVAPAAAGPVRGKPWVVEIAQATVQGGRIHWLDETLASPAKIDLTGLDIEASQIALPFTAAAPLRFKGGVGLEPSAPAAVASASTARNAKKTGRRPSAVATASAAVPPAVAARLNFSGTATDKSAEVKTQLIAWPLNMAAKYVGQFLLPALDGQLDADLLTRWQAADEHQAQVLTLAAPQLTLSDVTLAQGRNSLVTVKRVALAQVDIDVAGQSFKAATLLLDTPKARVERDADQRWMYERWRVGQGAPGKAPPPATGAGQTQAPSWKVAINDLQLDGGAVSFSDRAGPKPVAFEITAMKARLRQLALGDVQGKKQSSPVMPLTASLRLAAGRFEPGKLDFAGTVGLSPVQTEGRLTVDHLPVQAFEPYFADTLNIELLRADASFKGKVAYRQTPAGPQAQITCDAALEEFRANTLAPSEDLLAWKALNLRGLKVALTPATATRVDVRETVLTDFFARVIVMPDGRINLQDLAKPKAAVVPVLTAGQAAVPVLPVTKVETSANAGPAAIINFGPMSLVNGKVLFSDRFVKPNYSADLSEMTGKLSAFSSQAVAGAAPAMADLELRGKAEGTASLEITGKLNPLAKPLALDIKGKVRDLELPPLSPYAVKYSGYGITRGKLDVDVAYLVQPDGRLTASNKVVLNQLSFGDKVAGSTASLPVKLAVALLADRNGVIDLDLPISGSLNDPQFSIGPIIIKVILNVIVKAITAPFSLLANAMGGGAEDMAMVNFAAGSAALAPDARASLDKVAKALTDRPSLRLTVTGTSSLEAERDGYQRERLAERVQAEKRRQTVKDDGSATAPVTVTPTEYPALLTEVYKRADMPKPRNLVGLLKTQSVAEMENLLLADIKVSDDAIRELAVRRGVAVKDYLASTGLPTDRLFLGAAKAVPPEAKWRPRAELNLAMP